MSRFYCTDRGRKKDKPTKKSGMNDNWIPHAPTDRRQFTIAERDLEDWRELLNTEFPMMTPEEITRAEQAFHMLLLHDMIAAGDTAAAQEIHNLIRKEDREKARCRINVKISLRDQHEKLQHLADTLKQCYDAAAQGDPVAAIELKKKLAEEAVSEGDTWMARHFLLSSLSLCQQLSDQYEEEGRDVLKWSRIQAELHCMLAFLARESNETLENVLALAIDHLAICRRISKDQPWQFKPRVIVIKLKKPIAIHGLRTDENEIYDIVDGCSMPMYMIATLLEHELLISLANQIMHSHRSPTDEDLKIAHEFADHALKLALEVRQPTAMSSAYVRFGLVLRHSGAYDDALTYFKELSRNAVVTQDILTEGIAYHNIGLCLLGCHKSGEALESFAKQLDLATENGAQDLEADAMYELGHLFLQEGYMWEAEECYTISYEDFASMQHTNAHSLAAWSMLGVAAGHKTWGRFANLCRHNRPSDFYSVLGWKISRAPIRTNHRPSYKPMPISKAYPAYVKKMQGEPQKASGDSASEHSDFVETDVSEGSFHENESRAKYDDTVIKKKSGSSQTNIPLTGSKADIRGSGELPEGTASRTSIGRHRPSGEEEEEDEEEDEDEEEEEEDDEEEEEGELEVEEADYVDPDPDELPGYTRYKVRRVSSSAMIGEEMFIKVKKNTIIPEVNSDEENQKRLKEIEQEWKELKGKGSKGRRRRGEDGEWDGEDYDDQDDSDDDDDDDDMEWDGEGWVWRKQREWGGEDGEWLGEGENVYEDRANRRRKSKKTSDTPESAENAKKRKSGVRRARKSGKDVADATGGEEGRQSGDKSDPNGEQELGAPPTDTEENVPIPEVLKDPVAGKKKKGKK